MSENVTKSIKVCICFLVALLIFIAPSNIKSEQSSENTVVSEKRAKAKVLVYRYKQFTGSALKPTVFLDDGEIARMENGRFFTVNLAPGEYTFRSNDKQSGIKLKVESEKMYFIRIEIAPGGFKGHGRVILVPPEQGLVEVHKLSPSSRDKIINDNLVSAEDPPEK